MGRPAQVESLYLEGKTETLSKNFELAIWQGSSILHRDQAYDYGVKMASKLKDLIPRQQFEVPVQAAIGSLLSVSTSSNPALKLATAVGKTIINQIKQERQRSRERGRGR